MCAVKHYPIKTWKAERCDGCGQPIARGVVAYYSQTAVYHDHLCIALETLNDSPVPLLEEATK